jgi:hypothetical protein
VNHLCHAFYDMILILAFLSFGILLWTCTVSGEIYCEHCGQLCDLLCGLHHRDIHFDLCTGIYSEIMWDIYNDTCFQIYFEIQFEVHDYMISAKMEFDDGDAVGPEQLWP